MISDQAIENSKKDLFGRKNFSKKIAQIIAQRSEEASIVIGIHAPWGEGKTSVLNMIVEYLEEHIQKKDKTLLDGHIVIVKFNPWRFPDEEQLLRNFFHSLASALETSIETKTEKAGKIGKKYANAAAIFNILKLSAGWGAVSVEPNVSETLKKYAELISEAGVEKSKERIDELLRKDGRKIVITVDDIDRLEKEEIRAVFRLVKLTADFPNTIYVMCFDEDRVAEALDEKSGKAFSEKIIQLSLPLPILTPFQLIKLTYDRINALLDENKIKLSQERDGHWSYFFRSTFGDYLKSPRLVKKYINNLWFSFPHMKDELDILDLQTIEAVHIFFPKLYKIIRNNKNMFLLEPSSEWFRKEEEKKHIENLEKLPEEFPEQDRETIKKIVQELFPRTKGVFANNHYGTDWYATWDKEKRIASPKYCQRYFDLMVSDDDISDSVIANFIEQLANNNDKQNIDKVTELISNNRQNLFLQKIFSFIDNLEDDKTIKLARAVAPLGDLFPKGNQDDILLTMTPFSDAARLLRYLVEKITDEDHRLKVATEIASIISPLDFAYEYFRFAQYIGKDKNDPEDKKELSELGKAIVNKIVERTEIEAKQEKLENRYPQYSANLYRAWLFEKSESLKEYLEKRFSGNPQEAEDFIMSFAKQSWAVNGTAIVWGLDFIVSAIEQLHPNMKLLSLENYTKDSNYHPETEEDYLIYFVSIAKKISESRNQ